MKMLWQIRVLESTGETRDGWIAADDPVQALKMAMKEKAELCGDPEVLKEGERNQVFLKVH